MYECIYCPDGLRKGSLGQVEHTGSLALLAGIDDKSRVDNSHQVAAAGVRSTTWWESLPRNGLIGLTRLDSLEVLIPATESVLLDSADASATGEVAERDLPHWTDSEA